MTPRLKILLSLLIVSSISLMFTLDIDLDFNFDVSGSIKTTNNLIIEKN